MSFSSDVKEEISKHFVSGRHCQIAEIAAIIAFSGKIEINNNKEYSLSILTENVAIARKYFTLIKKTFNINTEISVRRNLYLKKNRTYVMQIRKPKDAFKILKTIKFLDENDEYNVNRNLVDGLIIQKNCCKRAFIRGAFMANGSISDPEKFYHFEIVCDKLSDAERMCEIIGAFDVKAKIINRKKYFVVYIKEAALIVDMLNIMEAHVALMSLENIRILKEMRNSTNRGVNCEMANINKMISAASKQIRDIKLIQEKLGFDELSKGLKEIAILRLENPDTGLKELGEMLDPPVGKSGVNHRLRKLSEIAEELRSEGGME